MYGTHTFSDGLGKINNELLEARILYNMVGPTPCLADIYNFDKPKVVERPRLLSEDVYDLYFKRTKLLFENSDDVTIENYLNKRFKMTPTNKSVDIETADSEIKTTPGTCPSGWTACWNQRTLPEKLLLSAIAIIFIGTISTRDSY